MSNQDFPFDDPLDDLLGGEIREPKPLPTHFTPAVERVFTEACTKCGGSGSWRGRGQCFACKGKGTFSFKTPPEARAAARTSSAARGKRRLAERANERSAWREAHKAEVAWLEATAERQHERAHKGQSVWNFPVDLSESLAKFGSLTEPQVAAVRKFMVRDAERRAEAEKAKGAAPAVDASKIAAAFERAREAARADGEDLMDLRLRLDTFTFSPSRDGDGSIWIRDKIEKTWVGKIAAGAFVRFRACTDDQQARVLAAAADPAAAAKAFGQRFTQCSCCGRTLTNKVSREMGIGPICAEKWGF